ncbi:splicing factor ESS-2 homolog isoform X2 [Planococcus citri]
MEDCNPKEENLSEPGSLALKSAQQTDDLVFNKPLPVDASKNTIKVDAFEKQMYLKEIGKIMKRDFLPDFLILKAQNEYSSAIENNDSEKLDEIYGKYGKPKKRNEINCTGTRFQENHFNEERYKKTIRMLEHSHVRALDGKGSSSQTPEVNGHSFLKTPSPMPRVDETPLMVSGEIDGTPSRLSDSKTPIRPGLPAPPLREPLAYSLPEKIYEMTKYEKKIARLSSKKFIITNEEIRKTVDRMNNIKNNTTRFIMKFTSHLRNADVKITNFQKHSVQTTMDHLCAHVKSELKIVIPFNPPQPPSPDLLHQDLSQEEKEEFAKEVQNVLRKIFSCGVPAWIVRANCSIISEACCVKKDEVTVWLGC